MGLGKYWHVIWLIRADAPFRQGQKLCCSDITVARTAKFEKEGFQPSLVQDSILTTLIWLTLVKPQLKAIIQQIEITVTDAHSAPALHGL